MIEFSKALSIDGIIHVLHSLIEELVREGFNTPGGLMPVVPTGEEGTYKVPDDFSSPNP